VPRNLNNRAVTVIKYLHLRPKQFHQCCNTCEASHHELNLKIWLVMLSKTNATEVVRGYFAESFLGPAETSTGNTRVFDGRFSLQIKPSNRRRLITDLACVNKSRPFQPSVFQSLKIQVIVT
jgi:hypothetical protein